MIVTLFCCAVIVGGSIIKNIFITASFFNFLFADRRVLTLMHLFGIGQGYKPYPTNMRQRTGGNTYI
jgi:hypothetical protein